jgi:hypothetical protein
VIARPVVLVEAVPAAAEARLRRLLPPMATLALTGGRAVVDDLDLPEAHALAAAVRLDREGQLLHDVVAEEADRRRRVPLGIEREDPHTSAVVRRGVLEEPLLDLDGVHLDPVSRHVLRVPLRAEGDLRPSGVPPPVPPEDGPDRRRREVEPVQADELRLDPFRPQLLIEPEVPDPADVLVGRLPLDRVGAVAPGVEAGLHSA